MDGLTWVIDDPWGSSHDRWLSFDEDNEIWSLEKRKWSFSFWFVKIRTFTYDICTNPSFQSGIFTTSSSAIHRFRRTTPLNGRQTTPIPRFLFLHISWNRERSLWLGCDRWYMCKIKSARGWWYRRRKNLIYRRPFPCNCIMWQTFSLCNRPKRYVYSLTKGIIIKSERNKGRYYLRALCRTW